MITDAIKERARELGRIVGQTQEYQALERARTRVNEDRELVRTINRLSELEVQIGNALRSGNEPSDETKDAYEREFGVLQASSVYQSLVAAQANFEKLLAHVNDQVTQGITTGSQSRIILPG
ncbi:MAG: YlbF family regulator [Gemmatimonadetes bacterium]|nr:YlbF family regulator [Gemmatimonadota bacterium]